MERPHVGSAHKAAWISRSVFRVLRLSCRKEAHPQTRLGRETRPAGVMFYGAPSAAIAIGRVPVGFGLLLVQGAVAECASLGSGSFPPCLVCGQVTSWPFNLLVTEH